MNGGSTEIIEPNDGYLTWENLIEALQENKKISLHTESEKMQLYELLKSENVFTSGLRSYLLKDSTSTVGSIVDANYATLMDNQKLKLSNISDTILEKYISKEDYKYYVINHELIFGLQSNITVNTATTSTNVSWTEDELVELIKNFVKNVTYQLFGYYLDDSGNKVYSGV